VNAWDILEQDAPLVAPLLLGWQLVHDTAEGRTAGIIIETEAYHQDDPASHSFNGVNNRNAPMFGPAGHAYVYRSYGMHWCMNVVTGNSGFGQGVLIRALFPTEGIPLMEKRRGRRDHLCSGPGKLTQAMDISHIHNGHDLREPPLFLIPYPSLGYTATPRIGIAKAKEKPWRFVAQETRILA